MLLRVVYLVVGVTGIAAYAFRELLAKYVFPIYDYTVAEISRPSEDTIDVALDPVHTPFTFVPGQFVALAFGGAGGWYRHPFSVASAPSEPRLEVTIKALGDYTRTLHDKLEAGTPAIVQRALVLPPASRVGPVTPAERKAAMENSIVRGQYEKAIDRESAYEKLKNRTLAKAGATEAPARSGQPPASNTETGGSGLAGTLAGVLFGTTGPRGGHHDGLLDSAAKSAARAVGSNVGRAIIRGTLGSIFGGRSR
jgi:hypothetical protein